MKEIIDRMIANSGKSLYRINKEYGGNIWLVKNRDIRVSTLKKIAKVCGYRIVLIKGKGEMFEI